MPESSRSRLTVGYGALTRASEWPTAPSRRIVRVARRRGCAVRRELRQGRQVAKSARTPAVALLRQLILTRQFGKSRIIPKVLEKQDPPLSTRPLTRDSRKRDQGKDRHYSFELSVRPARHLQADGSGLLPKHGRSEFAGRVRQTLTVQRCTR